MIANYHTHTPRCNHATGTESEYAQAALQAGLNTLGFSDHTPQRFPGDYYSTFRMRPEQLRDYASSVLAVRDQFRDRLEIRLGVEAEYYPALFGDIVRLLRDHGVEYMILGQHFLDNEMDAYYAMIPTAEDALLQKYCDQSIDAMHTGLFSYFAHPDLIRYEGDEEVYRKHIRRLCRASKECGMPLEINLLGVREGRHYPVKRFWEIAAEEGCAAILGADAHSPEALLNLQAVQKAEAMAKHYGLKLLDTLELRTL